MLRVPHVTFHQMSLCSAISSVRCSNRSLFRNSSSRSAYLNVAQIHHHRIPHCRRQLICEPCVCVCVGYMTVCPGVVFFLEQMVGGCIQHSSDDDEK